MANARIIQYRREASGWYVRLPELVPFKKIPDELKVEDTQDDTPRSNGAENIIRGRHEKGGRYLFYTGLRRTPGHCWYAGDFCEFVRGQKVKSTLLFEFSADFSTLAVHWFDRYHVWPSEVPNLLANYLPGLRRD